MRPTTGLQQHHLRISKDLAAATAVAADGVNPSGVGLGLPAAGSGQPPPQESNGDVQTGLMAKNANGKHA